jgi:hypothetical protein
MRRQLGEADWFPGAIENRRNIAVVTWLAKSRQGPALQSS